MSSESSYAHRAAVFYGPEIAQLSRVGRVDFLRQRIVAIETAEKQRRQQAEDEHKRNCDECRRGGMCLWDLTLDKEEMEVRNRLAFMRSLVHSEERDAEYAD